MKMTYLVIFILVLIVVVKLIFEIKREKSMPRKEQPVGDLSELKEQYIVFRNKKRKWGFKSLRLFIISGISFPIGIKIIDAVSDSLFYEGIGVLLALVGAVTFIVAFGFLFYAAASATEMKKNHDKLLALGCSSSDLKKLHRQENLQKK